MDIANWESRLKLSSPSTLVNLACSGHADWAMLTGGYYWMVGDSSSGKTVFTMGFLAEASINPAFDNYDLIFDNAEDGALMPVEKFFGKRLANRLQPPKIEDGLALSSRTADEFYFNLWDWFEKSKKSGRPFIYLLDSMDSLGTDYAEEKFLERKEAFEEGTEAAGDYGDGKAKINSTNIRWVRSGLQATNSILIVLSQTRDNPAAKAFQKKKVVAGGHALKFYAQWQLWSSIREELSRTVQGQQHQIGITAIIDIKKNRLSGKEWSVEVPIFWSSGLDDVGSCIDYLIKYKRFKKNDKGIIEASDFGFDGRRAGLIEKIQSEKLEPQLRQLVGDVWKSVEDRCREDRVSRYD